MSMNEKREPNGHFSYPLGNVISIETVCQDFEQDSYRYLQSDSALIATVSRGPDHSFMLLTKIWKLLWTIFYSQALYFHNICKDGQSNDR